MKEYSPAEHQRQADPLRNENILRKQTEWFRFIAPLLGLDRHKLIVGTILNRIIGDDTNIYFPVHDFVTDSNSIEEHKSRANARLAWELQTPEVPESIKEKVLSAKNVISGADWKNLNSFNRAKSAQEKLVAAVEVLIEKNSSLQDALTYTRDLKIQKRWRPYWQQFSREE